MRAVILQPTYLPWMGYFGMMDITDVFVFYDDVQFVERSWHRRNRVKMPNGECIWLSVPVKGKFGCGINEVKINTEVKWRAKHWTTIRHAYTRAPFFGEYAAVLQRIYDKEWEYLVDLNVTLIEKLAEMLEINRPEFLRSSELNVGGQKTDRLIGILKRIKANEYVSGPAAKSYIETEKFRDEGISLFWYEFNHPVYPQLHGNFIAYLSAIDLLFNVGRRSTDVIREGSENSLRAMNEVPIDRTSQPMR